jgi:hypothetical protein
MTSRAIMILLAASLSLAAARPAAAQVPLSTIGVPKAILDPSGVKLSVVVNAFLSPPKGVQDSPPSGGRWVVLDLTVTNVGTTPFQLTAGDFQLMAPDTTIYLPDGGTDLPKLQLAETALMPGDTVRGNIVFAIPSGVTLQLVTFQASGTAQWVVALLHS